MRKLPILVLVAAMLVLSGCAYKEVALEIKCTKVISIKTYLPYFLGVVAVESVPGYYALLEDGREMVVGKYFDQKRLCESVWVETQELNLNKRPPG